MPLEREVAGRFIPAITGHTCILEEPDLLALSARMGGIGFVNHCESATPEFNASVKVTIPLVKTLEGHDQALPNLEDKRALQTRARKY